MIGIIGGGHDEEGLRSVMPKPVGPFSIRQAYIEMYLTAGQVQFSLP